MRSIDAYYQLRKPVGRNSQPSHEPVRLRQEPSMSFAPSNLTNVSRKDGSNTINISLLGFGLFGPNGPLPLHITEYVRERIFHHKDATLSAFADIFHHRLISLFYRAWANAQSTINIELKDESFSRHIASLIGLGFNSSRNRDSIDDYTKFYFSGHLTRQTRNPEGLIQILRRYFNIPVRLQEYIPQWIKIPEHQQFRLNGDCSLGSFAVIGSQIKDVQHKFRLLLGPLSQQKFNSFLPNHENSQQLIDWVRLYIGFEFAWDVCLILKNEEIKGIQLGDQSALGFSSFLGTRKTAIDDFKELIIDYESRLTPAI